MAVGETKAKFRLTIVWAAAKGKFKVYWNTFGLNGGTNGITFPVKASVKIKDFSWKKDPLDWGLVNVIEIV